MINPLRNQQRTPRPMARATLALTTTIFGSTSLALAGTGPLVTPLVVGGDVYNGIDIVNSISAADFMTINSSGQWAIEATGAGSVSMLISGTGAAIPGAVIFAEGDDVPDPAPKDAVFISFDEMRINNNGNISANLFWSPPTNTDAVFFNTTLLIAEGDVSTASGFAAGTTWTNWWGTYIDDNDSILLIGNVDEPGVGDTSDPAVVVVSDPTGAATQTVLAKEGDELVTGRALANVSTSTHNNAFANGRALVVMDLDGATTDDGIVGLHDGTSWSIIIHEGSPSGVVAGRNWGAIGTATGLDINNNGDWVARTTLNSPTSDDTLIVKNGTEIIAREGQPVPAFVGNGNFNFGGFVNTAVHIDEDGDVYYYGSWNDPDSTKNAGIFRNDELLVQIGVTTADTGEKLTALSGGQANISVSDNGRYLLIEGTLTDTQPEPDVNRQGAIFVDLGASVPGDVDGDGIVNLFDLLELLAQWGTAGNADFTDSENGGPDGVVDLFDLLFLLANWG